MNILEQFDSCRDAVINPDMIYSPIPDFPETVVSIFSHQLFKVTYLHLYEFWPTRPILTVSLEGSCDKTGLGSASGN